jgi:hypothetical protein
VSKLSAETLVFCDFFVSSGICVTINRQNIARERRDSTLGEGDRRQGRMSVAPSGGSGVLFMTKHL